MHMASHKEEAYLWYSVCDLFQALPRYDLDTHSALGAYRCAALTTCVEGGHLSHKLAFTANRHQVFPGPSAEVCRKLMSLGGSLYAGHEHSRPKPPTTQRTLHRLQQVLQTPGACQ